MHDRILYRSRDIRRAFHASLQYFRYTLQKFSASFTLDATSWGQRYSAFTFIYRLELDCVRAYTALLRGFSPPEQLEHDAEAAIDTIRWRGRYHHLITLIFAECHMGCWARFAAISIYATSRIALGLYFTALSMALIWQIHFIEWWWMLDISKLPYWLLIFWVVFSTAWY